MKEQKEFSKEYLETRKRKLQHNNRSFLEKLVYLKNSLLTRIQVDHNLKNNGGIMFTNRIKKILLLLTVNSSISLIILTLFQYVSNAFSIGELMSWIALNTKSFTLYFGILTVLLLLTAKKQLIVLGLLESLQPRVKNSIKLVIIGTISYIAAFILNYYLQYFQLMRNTEFTIGWIQANFEIFYAGVLFLFFIILLCYSLIGNIYITLAVNLLFFIILGIANYNKMTYRVEPLFPSDFKQILQLKDIIPMISGSLSITQIVLILALFIVGCYIIFYLPKIMLPKSFRAIVAIGTAVMVFSFLFYPKTFIQEFLKYSKVTAIKWEQQENYQKNGFVFAFLSNMQGSGFPKPEGYSKEKIIEIAKRYQQTDSDMNDVSKQERPNIIYLMNEAFWDPTLLPNATFSEDPMKNVRELMEVHTSGKSLSPAFGGATANAEFEALTGFSSYILPSGSIPYQDIIDKKSFIPSIVSNLESEGYRSLAMHPYKRYFYKRNKVYETLSFEKFLDMDTMANKEKSGPIISDESVSNEITDNIKNQKKPMFIHAVTMQNHLPYNPGRYESNSIDVSGLSTKANEELEVYTEGIKQADAALKLLIDEIEKLEEPTMIVFWGDHLPALGIDRSVYKEGGFVSDENPDLQEKRYSETPLLIYSNFPVENKKLETISPSYLGPIVYDLIGLEKPPFYNLLDQLKAELPGLKKSVVLDSDQHIVKQLSKKQNQLLEDYKYIQYDLLVGNQYSKSILFPD